MRKTTENTKEKIVNFWKENKEILGEFIAIFAFGLLSLLLSIINLDEPHGIQIMLCIILFNTLWAQFHAQRAYYAVKDMKEQEKKK
jgi:hypothetical protein